MSIDTPDPEMDSYMRRIRVKFLYRGRSENGDLLWLRQFPGYSGMWGNCHFILDKECQEYDWLVIYDDLPPQAEERFSKRNEILRCPPSNTLLITSEPSTIKVYGRHYLRQFAHILTTQEPWVMRHPGAVYSQCGFRWFYGIGSHSLRSWDHMKSHVPDQKSELISTVCSSKKQKNTVHATRFEFTQYLKRSIPELEIFGRGVRAIDDKAEALDPYKYHVVIENHSGLNHWSEKIADAFLGHTLPFYFGCPNILDYFPRESMILIDPYNPESSARIIRQAIESNEYDKRKRYILEARNLILEKYNIFAVISEFVEKTGLAADIQRKYVPNVTRISGRRRIRDCNILHWTTYFYDRYSVKLKHYLNRAGNR